jgi:hypothetical protein
VIEASDRKTTTRQITSQRKPAMSQRYHRGGTYQTRNLLAVHNPLRSIPMFQPASILIRLPMPTFAPSTAPVFAPYERSANDLLISELANAEAALRDVVRVYDAARAAIGEANRHTLPDTLPAFIRRQTGPFVPVRLSAKRIRARKSAAFTMFNRRRGELSRARCQVDAARSALGLPSLAATEERAAIAVVVRASKHRGTVHHAVLAA